ncbi:MAG: PilZ domain-containing protein [bacterium]
MSDEELDRQYQRTLRAARDKGQVLGEYDGVERRRNPRIKVVPGHLPVEIDPWVFAIDVSLSGVAFYSDQAVEPGKTVDIDLVDMEPVKARVIACQEEESDSPYLPSRYRLHCEFEDEEKGKELLVRIKELDSESYSPGPS